MMAARGSGRAGGIGYSLVGIAFLGILGTIAYLGLQVLLWYLKTQHPSGLMVPLSISAGKGMEASRGPPERGKGHIG